MKKVLTLIGLALIITAILAGCGGKDVARPQGIYEHNGSTLEFSKNKVVVTEGNVSTTCDYSIDEEGNIIIDPDGEEILASYKKESDVVSINNRKFRKGSSASYEETSASVEAAESNMATKRSNDYNKDMFSANGGYFAITEDEIFCIYLRRPDEKTEGRRGNDIKIVASLRGREYQNIEGYKDLYAEGNTITWVREDGTEVVWTYDEDKNTLTSGEYCLYKADDAVIEELFNSHEQVLDGVYSGIYDGGWSVGRANLSKSIRAARFTFTGDHYFESTLNETYDFLRGQYFIENGTFYWYDGFQFRIGTYDEVTDTVSIYEMTITQQTEEQLQTELDARWAEWE